MRKYCRRQVARRYVVANDDDAFNRFYANNAKRTDDWKNATSYDRLSTAQKKIMLNSSMINNAYLMELMSNTSGSGDATEHQYADIER
jgi:hypothetical protein